MKKTENGKEQGKASIELISPNVKTTILPMTHFDWSNNTQSDTVEDKQVSFLSTY